MMQLLNNYGTMVYNYQIIYVYISTATRPIDVVFDINITYFATE
jgi:hypothetical protein